MHLSPTAVAYLATLAAMVLLLSAASRRWYPRPGIVWLVAAHGLFMAAVGHFWLPERTLGGQTLVTEMSYVVLVFGATVVALALPVAAAGGGERRWPVRLAVRLVVTYGVIAAIAGHLWWYLGPEIDESLQAGGIAYTCQVPREPGAYVCT